MSGETKIPSSHEGDEDEEEEEAESDSPLKGRKKKRAASTDPEEEAPKRGKMALSDGSDSEAEPIKKLPRVKPLAESPARDLPNPSLSEGSSLPPEMVQSAKSGLNEAFTSLLTGFKASLLAATAQATEVSELNRKLKLADDEIGHINKWFDETQGSAAEDETLKSALAQAKEEAKASKAATAKAAEELKTAQVARRQHEERVAEVEQELKDAVGKCEALEEKTTPKRTNSPKPSMRPRRHVPSPGVLVKRSGRPNR
nr:uncharacterized protein CG45076-like [Aegilops tauschii subsp. strangulata]